MQFYAMFVELVHEVTLVIRFVVKLNSTIRNRLVRLQKHPEEAMKLFTSPKKPSRDYQKALTELKSYVWYLTNHFDINTGRELTDIKRAVEGYLSAAGSAKKEVVMGLTQSGIFMTSPMMIASPDPSTANRTLKDKKRARYQPPPVDDDTLEFNR